MPERHERVLVRWHCDKVKGHAELKIENPRVKSLSYDLPKLHHSKTNSFCANVHLRQSFWKTVKVTKKHVTSHQGQSIKNRRGTHGPPVPQIWCNSDYYLQSYGILKKMAHVIFLWSAAIFKVSVEPYRPKKSRSDSGLFSRVIDVNIARCNLCARAKVKGHIKLKIEENSSVGKLVEPFQIWSSCTSFRFMGYSRQKWHSFFSTIGNNNNNRKEAISLISGQFYHMHNSIKVTWRHTRVKSRKIEGAPKVPLCTKYGAIPTIISGVTAFWKC